MTKVSKITEEERKAMAWYRSRNFKGYLGLSISMSGRKRMLAEYRKAQKEGKDE